MTSLILNISRDSLAQDACYGYLLYCTIKVRHEDFCVYSFKGNGQGISNIISCL